MPVAASTILARARALLADTGSPQRWTDAELLGYLSDAQRTVAATLPFAAPVVAVVELVAGTRQAVPSAAQKLITVYRNKAVSGAAGPPVIEVSREHMDMLYASWHTATAAANATMYTYDEADPLAFYVYPPNNGSGAVELNYSVMPADLTATTDNLSVLPIFQPALLDYVMARAHMKDSDYAAGQSVASSYMSLFTAFITAYQQSRGAK